MMGKVSFSNRMQGNKQLSNDIGFSHLVDGLAAGLYARLERWSGRNPGCPHSRNFKVKSTSPQRCCSVLTYALNLVRSIHMYLWAVRITTPVILTQSADLIMF